MKRRVLAAWTVVVLAVLPILVGFDPYWLTVFTSLAINALLGTTIWVLFVVGRLTLGHAAFYGMGAYGVSLLIVNAGWNFWVALPVVLLAVALVAVAVGFPTLRARGAYFVLTTFAFAEIVRLGYVRFAGLSGGAQGLFGIPRPDPIVLGGDLLSISFSSYASQYYLILAALAIVSACFVHYVNTPLGLVLKSVHDEPALAQALGINVFAHLLVTFVVSAVGAALAGALYAVSAGYIEPNLFGIHTSINAQAFAIIGGIGSVSGPIVGAAFLTMLSEGLHITRTAAPLVTGVALIVASFLLRGGLVTLPSRLAWFVASKCDRTRRLPRATHRSRRPRP